MSILRKSSIPGFLINEETDKLVEVFTVIKRGEEAREYRPGWLKEYEETLTLSNPYIRTIEEISQKIEQLRKLKKSLRKKDEDVRVFINLLAVM